MLLPVTALFHFHCYITQMKRDPRGTEWKVHRCCTRMPGRMKQVILELPSVAVSPAQERAVCHIALICTHARQSASLYGQNVLAYVSVCSSGAAAASLPAKGASAEKWDIMKCQRDPMMPATIFSGLLSRPVLCSLLEQANRCVKCTILNSSTWVLMCSNRYGNVVKMQ